MTSKQAKLPKKELIGHRFKAMPTVKQELPKGKELIGHRFKCHAYGPFKTQFARQDVRLDI